MLSVDQPLAICGQISPRNPTPIAEPHLIAQAFEIQLVVRCERARRNRKQRFERGTGSLGSFTFLKWKFLLLGCHGFWQAVEVYLIGRFCFQAEAWSGPVVEVDVAVEQCSCLADRCVGVQINLLILDGLPDSLDEDVLAPASATVHADEDSVKGLLPEPRYRRKPP